MNVETGTLYRATLLDVRDGDGLPADPVTLTYTVTKPDQTTATPTVVKDSKGNYHADYLTTVAGLHRGTWAGTAPNLTETDQWNVITYRSVLSLTEAREFLDLRDTSRDEVLRSMLTGITALLERYTGTLVIRQVTDERIPGETRDVLRLPSGPLPTADAVTSVTSVWADGPSWAAAGLIVDPDAGTVRPANGLGFWGGPWKATYTAGRRVIPADVIEGAKAALWDLWATQRGVSADSLEPGLDTVTAYESALPPGWRLSPRVMQLIGGETMPGFA